MSIHDAKGHLEHFCACLPTVPYADQPRPEYILESLPDGQFRADVVLPPGVNIFPRRVSGKLRWASQKMAIKDAAFCAYAGLYEAELINENLLPTSLPDPVVRAMEDDTEEVASLLCVRERMKPWTIAVGSQESICRQALTIRAQFLDGQELPSMHLLLPAVFDIAMSFKMFWTNEPSIDIEIVPESVADETLFDDKFLPLSRLSSQRLFESIFQGKMQSRREGPRGSRSLSYLSWKRHCCWTGSMNVPATCLQINSTS